MSVHDQRCVTGRAALITRTHTHTKMNPSFHSTDFHYENSQFRYQQRGDGGRLSYFYLIGNIQS